MVHPDTHTHTHTVVRHRGGGTRQPTLILGEIRVAHATSVLEIGAGRGYCTLFLAACAPDVRFHGVDLLATHVAAARAAARTAGLTNATFEWGDALAMAHCAAFDVIFGCEALCHLADAAQRDRFMALARRALRPGGRIVIVDGFRSVAYERASPAQQAALRCAERGFAIGALPTKAEWSLAGAAVGPGPTIYTDRHRSLAPPSVYSDRGSRSHTRGASVLGDGTTLGVGGVAQCQGRPKTKYNWRHAPAPRWLLWILPTRLLRWYAGSSPARRSTGGNIRAALTVAHALRGRGAAEYGLLVLRWNA